MNKVQSVGFWGVLAVSLALVMGAARCTSFTASAPGDAGDAGDGSDAPDSGRTLLRCGNPGSVISCAIGEHCCESPDGDVCSAICAAGTYDFECGRLSDCGDGKVCCGSQNGDSTCGGHLYGSACVPVANCPPCGDAGGGMSEHLCDPASGTDCPAGATCTFVANTGPYTACSF